MDDNKGKDEACLAASVSECTVSEVAEQALPGPAEVLMAVSGQNEGSFAEGFKGEPCNGDDLMVEVLGSEVYVGGVCTSGSGENLDDSVGEIGCGNGEGIDVAGLVSERPENGSVSGDGNVIGGLDSGEARVLDGSDLSRECEIRKEAELVVEETVEGDDRVSDAVVTTEESETVGSGGVEVLGLSGGDRKADDGVDVELASKEGVGDGEKREVDGNTVGELVSGEGDECRDVGEQKIEDSGMGNGDGIGLLESQIVKEGVEVMSVKSDSELASEAAEQDCNRVGDKVGLATDLTQHTQVVEGEKREVDENTVSELVSYEGDASRDVGEQKIDVLDKVVLDSGTRNGGGVGIVETRIVEEVAVTMCVNSDSKLASETVEQDCNMVDDKVGTSTNLTEQKEVDNQHGFETMVTNSVTVESSAAETQPHEESDLETNKEMGLNTDKPTEDQGQVFDCGEVVVDKEVVLSSTVSVMEIDEVEKSSGLVKEEEEKEEIGSDTAENHNVDSVSVQQPTQVVLESEVTVTDVVSVSEQDKSLEQPEHFDNGTACDIPPVESNVGEGMELETPVMDAGQECVAVSNTEVPGTNEHLNPGDTTNNAEIDGVLLVSADTSQEIEVVNETTDAHQLGFHGQQVELEKQQLTTDKIDRTLEESHLYEDFTSLDQPTEVVGAEITAPSDVVPNSVNEYTLPDENFQVEVLERTTETETQVDDYVDVAPMDTEEVLISEFEVLDHPDTCQMLSNEESHDPEDADDRVEAVASDGFGSAEEQDLTVVKEAPEDDQINTSEQKVVIGESLEPESSSVVHKPTYELPPEHDGVFSVPDLVWGKVKSHPWWPGQIFDFTDASDKAMKHHKKDCFLVAYFGDRTFAWNEASTLKNFRTHFSQMVAQSNGETFHNAVRCALEEVSRRVELGLACPCLPKDSYDDIRLQIVENAGIRPESSRREVVDESANISLFRTDKLIEYVRALAQSPSDESDLLGFAVAKAQLLAFGRFKGYCSLPEFQFCGELVENDTAGPRFDTHPGDEFEYGSPQSKDDEQASSSQEIQKIPNRSSHKRKHNLRENPYKVKEKSLSELMGGSLDYPDEDNFSGKRRKSADAHADDSTTQDGRKTGSIAKVSNSTPPKQSFKIGECIRRVASQLTGSPSIKGSVEKVQKADGSIEKSGDEYDPSMQGPEGKAIDPTEYSSLNELLFQLHLIAEDPIKEYSFSNVIVNFFTDFRNSIIGGNQYSLVVAEKVGSKRKKGTPETFEFDDMNDTYWTDRVIQNGAEEQPPPRKNKKKDNQSSTVQSEKTPQEGRRPYNRKRISNGDHSHTVTPQKPPGYISENAPTELVMNFADVSFVPTESNLNKMFKRFGPLKESETEVDRFSSRARVIFKKCSDAEIAFNSAAKFNIFGPTLVNYELSYTPTLQFKPVPVAITQDHETQLDLSAHEHDMQLVLSAHEHDMHLDLSAHDHEMQLDLSNLAEFEVNLV